MIEIVIDSNLLVATLDKADTWNDKARQIIDAIPTNAELLFFDIVIAESLSAIARRFEEKGRSGTFPTIIKKIRSLIPHSKITWVTPFLPQYYSEILNIMSEHKGILNFNDAFIALYMKKMRYRYIASFDSDFDVIPSLVRVSTAKDIEKHFK